MATAAAENPPQQTTRIRVRCRSCGKLNARHSRKGLWFRCKHCGVRQPGPGMAQEALAAPPAPPRTRTRKALATAASTPTEVAPAAAEQAPRPVAAKVTRAAPAPAERKVSGAGLKSRSSLPTGTREEASGAPAPSTPPRRSFVDRLLYGEND